MEWARAKRAYRGHPATKGQVARLALIFADFTLHQQRFNWNYHIRTIAMERDDGNLNKNEKDLAGTDRAGAG